MNSRNNVNVPLDQNPNFIDNEDGTKTLLPPDNYYSGTYISLKPDNNTKRRLEEIVKVSDIQDAIPFEDLHTTLVYSVHDGQRGQVVTNPSLKYVTYFDKVQILGKALVIKLLDENFMLERFRYFQSLGIIHSFDSLIPHISIKYYDDMSDPNIGEDLAKLKTAILTINNLYNDPNPMYILTGENSKIISGNDKDAFLKIQSSLGNTIDNKSSQQMFNEISDKFVDMMKGSK